MTSAIQARSLVKRYRQATVNAVDGISFDVASRQFLALLRPDAAGKTSPT